MVKCPKCNSTNVNQFKMRTGPIWCVDCGFRVEEKENDNSFFNQVECEHKNSYMFHENAPEFCPDCKKYVDGGKVINTQ